MITENAPKDQTFKEIILIKVCIQAIVDDLNEQTSQKKVGNHFYSNLQLEKSVHIQEQRDKTLARNTMKRSLYSLDIVCSLLMASLPSRSSESLSSLECHSWTSKHTFPWHCSNDACHHRSELVTFPCV